MILNTNRSGVIDPVESEDESEDEGDGEDDASNVIFSINLTNSSKCEVYVMIGCMGVYTKLTNRPPNMMVKV